MNDDTTRNDLKSIKRQHGCKDSIIRTDLVSIVGQYLRKQPCRLFRNKKKHKKRQTDRNDSIKNDMIFVKRQDLSKQHYFFHIYSQQNYIT